VGVTITITASAETATVGAHLVGPNGRTLYVQIPFHGCSDVCPAIWPLLLVGQNDQLVADYPKTTTVGGKSVATCTLTVRQITGGRFQAAACDRLLFYYYKDTAAGQTNGDGFAGIWFVAPLTP
jgi:predicted lipoprotein with Yx(FWY)xxD motif